MVKYVATIKQYKDEVGTFINKFSSLQSKNGCKIILEFAGTFCKVTIETTNDVEDEFITASLKDGMLNHWGYGDNFIKVVTVPLVSNVRCDIEECPYCKDLLCSNTSSIILKDHEEYIDFTCHTAYIKSDER